VKRINNATLSRGGAPGRVPVVDPELRAYLDERFGAVDRRFDTVDARFDSIDQRFGAADQRIDGVDQRLDTVDRRFVALETEVRHSGVLIEQVRHEVQVVAEMVVANTEAITQLRQRLDAR
jgi:archaellum component FlaC